MLFGLQNDVEILWLRGNLLGKGLEPIFLRSRVERKKEKKKARTHEIID